MILVVSQDYVGLCFFFFQAEDGIRDDLVTGVQTCALPILIEGLYSEVRLDPNRETYGYGQGRGVSGEAESRVAGFRFAPFAAANRPERAHRFLYHRTRGGISTPPRNCHGAECGPLYALLRLS